MTGEVNSEVFEFPFPKTGKSYNLNLLVFTNKITPFDIQENFKRIKL